MLEQSLCVNPNLNDKNCYAKSIIFLAIFIFKDNCMMKMAKVVILVFLFGFLGLFIFSCSNGSGGGSGDDSYYAPTTPSSNTGSSSNNGDNDEKYEDNDNTEEVPAYMDFPVYLKAGTDGTAGTEATYVLFGEWPQTVKAQNVEITKLIDQDKHLYLGSDGCKYFKMVANPYVVKDGWGNIKLSFDFDNESKIETGIEYYFKVEPIKWKVVTRNYNNTGNSLLYSEKVLLASIPYDPTFRYGWVENHTDSNYYFLRSSDKDVNIYPSDYEYSFIRAVLNGLSYISHNGNKAIDSYKIGSYEIKFKDNGFLQNAFSSEGQNLIKTTYVYNNSDSMRQSPTDKVADGEEEGTIDLRCNNTNDKIFLLSVSECILFLGSQRPYRYYSSDLARASYLCPYSKNYKGETIDLYLRTPVKVKNTTKGFNISYISGDSSVSCISSGICPALTIKLD